MMMKAARSSETLINTTRLHGITTYTATTGTVTSLTEHFDSKRCSNPVEKHCLANYGKPMSSFPPILANF
jgi:hypothetical protein